MAEEKNISQEAARELLSALKAFMKAASMVTGSVYTWDEYRQACMAVAKAEGTVTLNDQPHRQS